MEFKLYNTTLSNPVIEFDSISIVSSTYPIWILSVSRRCVRIWWLRRCGMQATCLPQADSPRIHIVYLSRFYYRLSLPVVGDNHQLILVQFNFFLVYIRSVATLESTAFSQCFPISITLSAPVRWHTRNFGQLQLHSPCTLATAHPSFPLLIYLVNIFHRRSHRRQRGLWHRRS
jgi:hypothetical protein